MTEAGERSPVKAKAVVLDPESLAIVWMNESALDALTDQDRRSPLSVSLDSIVPMAAELGVRETLGEVARDGVARHARTGLVSTSRGALAVVISMYRLPDDMLLLIMENAWQSTPNRSSESGGRRSGREGR